MGAEEEKESEKLRKEASELYGKVVKDQLQGTYKLVFDDLDKASIEDKLKAFEFLYNKDQAVTNFESASSKSFDTGIEEIVKDIFKDDASIGNFSKLEKEDQNSKTEEFMKKIITHALSHYDLVQGYDEPLMKIEELLDNQEHPMHTVILGKVFGHLFKQNEPITWDSVRKKLRDDLSEETTNIYDLFGLKDGKDNQAINALYTQLFSGARKYALSHIDPYKEKLFSHLYQLDADDQADDIKKVKEMAAEKLKLYGGTVGDSELELEIDKASFTHQKAVGLLAGLYQGGLGHAGSVKEYIDGGSKKLMEHISKYKQSGDKD